MGNIDKFEERKSWIFFIFLIVNWNFNSFTIYFFSVSLEKHIKLHHDDVTHIDLIALDDEVTGKYASTGRFSIRKVTFGRNALYILDMKSKSHLSFLEDMWE